jgi:hypothetical protein
MSVSTLKKRQPLQHKVILNVRSYDEVARNLRNELVARASRSHIMYIHVLRVPDALSKSHDEIVLSRTTRTRCGRCQQLYPPLRNCTVFAFTKLVRLVSILCGKPVIKSATFKETDDPFEGVWGASA